jgi:demethylmenaquinone methyltransferase / 2-methoxy-6-polyprenyl-1,4-benzoquinol methylase
MIGGGARIVKADVPLSGRVSAPAGPRATRSVGPGRPRAAGTVRRLRAAAALGREHPFSVDWRAMFAKPSDSPLAASTPAASPAAETAAPRPVARQAGPLPPGGTGNAEDATSCPSARHAGPLPPGPPGRTGTAEVGGGLDKSGRAIRDMFAAVARRYDLLNHLLSAGLDLWWRRRAAAAALQRLAPGPPGPPGSGGSPGALVLDLCAGTGDQALALRRRGARVAAADFCLPMLAIAQTKFRRRFRPRRRQPGGAVPPPRPLAADALALPFPPGRFAAATVAFGLRNVADLDLALRELAAALAPGGRLAVLEFAVPRAAPLRALYLFYFRRVLPWIGRLLSDSSSAYDYLPSSVLGFPQRRGFLDRMAGAGFADLGCQDLAAGIVCLYTGAIPGTPLATVSPSSPVSATAPSSPVSPTSSPSPDSSTLPISPISPISPSSPVPPISPIAKGRSDP